MEAKEVVNNLITLYREKRLAHAYLIETNNMIKCYEDVKLIIKGIFCKNNYKESCSDCNLCHLIDHNSLPSLITIEPDGKNIKKEAIEDLKSVFTKLPVYTNNNIYIIKYPEKMNATAYNKMLKFLEEPEDNIIGFFITENKDNVANTIVSRCELLKMNYNSNNEAEILGIEEDLYNNLYALAEEYINNIISKFNEVVWYNNNVLNKELTNRVEITVFVKILFNIYLTNFKQETNIKEKKILFKQIRILNKYLEELNFNVNTSLLLDSLAIELGEAYEI